MTFQRLQHGPFLSSSFCVSFLFGLNASVSLALGLFGGDKLLDIFICAATTFPFLFVGFFVFSSSSLLQVPSLLFQNSRSFF